MAPAFSGCCNMEAKIKGFFGSKTSKVDGMDKAEQVFDKNELEAKIRRCQDELFNSKKRNDQLQSTLNDRERHINGLESEIQRMRLTNDTENLGDDDKLNKYRKEVAQRDERINQLKNELENVIQQKNKELDALNQKMLSVMDEKDYQIRRLNALGGTGGKKDGNIRTAISAETGKKIDPSNLPTIPKTKAESELIMDALLSNTFMKTLSRDQLQKIVDTMEKKQYPEKIEIIREGSDGQQMFVLDKGAVTVTKGAGQDKQFICDLGVGQLFGELAILYNCRRTATITTKTDVKLWALDRQVFQYVVRSAGQERDEERLQLLSKVKDLKQFPEEKLRKIVDCLEEEQYDDGHCIFRQGAVGDLFYIIRSGNVRITKDQPDGTETEVAVLGAGDFFGERALLKEDKRNANIYAKGATHVYTLDRTAFINLVGRVSEQENNTTLDLTEEVEKNIPVKNEIASNCKFSDIEIITPLGQGGFGLVKLVRVKGVDDKAFALKCIQKVRVVQYGQQRHIMDERGILSEMQSNFILRLYKTFKDNKFVFLLTDAYLGGDLWSVIYGTNRGPFNDAVARFYVACVVEAFGYLHKRHYCYRDLKPENLMVDNNGYVRLVDLGFAKKVPPGHKTWTFCGTPEYIPPEIISNKGHNIAADYWSLGILIFELLARRTPFRAKDDLAIYEGILRGIHSVQFPSKMSRKAESIIKSLCRSEPSERIGYQKAGVNDIRKHRWFQGFDWEGLRCESLQAPMIPEIKDPFDCSNFEKLSDEDENSVPEETSGWDANF